MLELETMKKEVENIENEIKSTEIQIEIVKNLETPEKQNTILNCVNTNKCDGIGSGLIERLDLLRSFILIEHLASEKLSFDQKFVLRNINEFLATQ